MKIITLSQSWLFAVVGLLLTQTAFAQAPSGSMTSPTFSGAQGLYDLTGVLTNITEDFTSVSSGATRTISEAVIVVQSVTGALSAGGTTTSMTADYSSGPVTFTATYTLKGAVKSSGSNVLISLSFGGRGNPIINGVTYRAQESLTYLVTIDPTAGTMAGRATGTASSSGTGVHTGVVKITNPAFGPEPSPFTPVDWSLSLTNLTTSGTKVSCSATVSLSNNRSFPFTVKGIYSATTGTKLTLTGTGTGKGAKLAVKMTGNHITGINGSLLGQKVNLSGL